MTSHKRQEITGQHGEPGGLLKNAFVKSHEENVTRWSFDNIQIHPHLQNFNLYKNETDGKIKIPQAFIFRIICVTDAGQETQTLIYLGN